MGEKKQPSYEQYFDEGDVTVHQPTGKPIRFGDDGTVGEPIVWDESDNDGWRVNEVVEKAVGRRRRREERELEPHEE